MNRGTQAQRIVPACPGLFLHLIEKLMNAFTLRRLPRPTTFAMTIACMAIGWSMVTSADDKPQPTQGPASRRATASLIVRNARITTLDPHRPEASALAVAGEQILAVGSNDDVEPLRGDETVVVDAQGRRIIPGLNDSHLHITRQGRFYNLELRWDGIDSLERALQMVAEQAKRTPAGQWVRVVGSWSPYQFKERRLPTPAELTKAAPDTPVLVLFLYSQGYLNKAGVSAMGITPATKAPPGCRYELTADGAILHAEPSPVILYQAVAALPALSADDQLNSCLHWYRELNRFGVTSAVDAGGGGHNFPADYAAAQHVAAQGKPPIRIANYLFAQRAGNELPDYQKWTDAERLQANLAVGRLNGYLIYGAGENLVASAADYENFMADRPRLNDAKLKSELSAVARLLVRKRWPIRIHATYDESISQMLDVFEAVDREIPFSGHRWAIDHAETLQDANIARIKRLGGGVAVQNRMYFAGEYFVERYGKAAAAEAPPIRKLLAAGVPVGGGTDATRVSCYNPWLSLYWMVSGKTAGGLEMTAPQARLSRLEALTVWTVGSAWFSADETRKGRLASGQLADFAVLSDDYFEVPEDDIRRIESVLTVVGGDVVHTAANYADNVRLRPAELPAVSPSWSPVATFGGYPRQQSSKSR
jgi:predicted amidohydrolase YtcJ